MTSGPAELWHIWVPHMGTGGGHQRVGISHGLRSTLAGFDSTHCSWLRLHIPGEMHFFPPFLHRAQHQGLSRRWPNPPSPPRDRACVGLRFAVTLLG